MSTALAAAAALALLVPVLAASAAAPAAVHEVTLASVGLAASAIGAGDAEAAMPHARFAAEFYANNAADIDAPASHEEAHLLLLDASSLLPAGDAQGAARALESVAQALRKNAGTAGPSDHIEMLAVAEKSYREGIIYSSDSAAALGVAVAARVAELVPDERLEEIAAKMRSRDADYGRVAEDIAYAQRTIFGAASVEIDPPQLYRTIRSLNDGVIEAAEAGNYALADARAVEAYLDNFEYLEPLIGEIDEGLMLSIEEAMRVGLRGLIAERAPAQDVREHIERSILPGLEEAEGLTAGLEPSRIVATGLAEPGSSLARMGSASDTQKATVRDEIDTIRALLAEAAAMHDAGEHAAAYAAARSAYLDSYELIEIPLRAISPDFTLEVEHQFAVLRNLVRAPADRGEVREAIAGIERNLDESERLVGGTGTLAPAIAFVSSFAIIFREGLEAVLILGAILTYLEASRNTRFKRHLLYGVAAAIGATGATWVAAQFLIEISGASRELIEAIAALSATAVLFYVSFWVLNKIEHRKWMEFVKAKVWQATATGSASVFVMLSFFTVYREGFESVLFYQAMIGFARYSELYVVLGFVLGLLVLFGVYYGMRRLGRRLPLRALFGLTMGVGAYLSVAFLGNAVRELQVLDIVPYTSMLGTIPRLDVNVASMTGIYPTLETTVAQAVLAGVYVAASSYVLVLRPRRARRLEAMRQSRGGAQ